MDPKITKKFNKKFDSKVITRQYFHRKTVLKKNILLLWSIWLLSAENVISSYTKYLMSPLG